MRIILPRRIFILASNYKAYSSLRMSLSSAIQEVSLFREQSYINGQWIGASDSDSRFPVHNPATGEIIGRVYSVSDADVNNAISAATHSFPIWKNFSYKKKELLLKKWSDLIKENSNDISLIMSAESGKILKESRGEVAYAVSFLDFYIEEMKRSNGEIIPSVFNSQRLLVLKEPIGVCSLITPWNFPAAMIIRKAGAALAAGCTTVVKPAEDTPFTALALATLAEKAGIPPGVFNVITSSRSDVNRVGELMCRHPDVRQISFTGSTKVGKILMEHAASGVKKVSMELGGNAPFIVFDDADINSAIEGLMQNKFRFGGQTCISSNRIFIHNRVKEEFLEKLLYRMEKLTVGDPLSSSTDMGPLINKAAVARVRGLVADAIRRGAKVHIGGEEIDREDNADGSSFFKPVLLTECSEKMGVFQDEIFGPVVPIFTFDDEAEALRMANNSSRGLAGYMYSQNLSRIFRFSERMEVGMVGVNETGISRETIPFGGVKESGIGREGSSIGLDEYVELKYVCLGGLESKENQLSVVDSKVDDMVFLYIGNYDVQHSTSVCFGK